MIKTRMTELFGIEHPIMLAGMNWITDTKLVAAVSNAGGLGVLATARHKPEELRESIREIRNLTDRPFGVNCILIGPGGPENVRVAIEEKVPVLNYTLGKPWFINEVHAYGGKVIGTTALVKHAQKAATLGCDAVIVTGHEAAAHGDKATSLILVPLASSTVQVPIIAAGGFYNGRGLAAALAMGAEGISMGSRFMLTQECSLHQNFKNLCLAASEQDTLYDTVFDGMVGRVLKSHGAEALQKRGFPVVEAIKAAKQIKDILGLSSPQFIGLSIKMMGAGDDSKMFWIQARQAVCAIRHLKAINEGDKEEGILFAGQSIGGINDIPSVKDLINVVIKEAEQTSMSLVSKIQKEDLI